MVIWLSAAGAFAQKADSLSLLFVGDLMQHQAQLDAARMPDGSYDYTDCFRWVSPEFAKVIWKYLWEENLIRDILHSVLLILI